MENAFASKIVGGNPATERNKSDFYPTPPDATVAILRFLSLPKETVIWEPACGEGDMVGVMRSCGYSVVASDISFGQDFLKMPIVDCDWIITNPPFSLADKFIEQCAKHKKPFALLLKSQYWHARSRFDLFDRIMPTFILPLTWRPNFNFKTKKNGSPLMDVIWCVWMPPYNTVATYHPLKREVLGIGKKHLTG